MRIAVLNTGGTISSIGQPLGPMSASAFATACTQILNPIVLQKFTGLEITYVEDLTFPESQSGTLDSTNLQPTDWCLIAGYILQNYASYDGWVVLHGTDSMDFTGAALPFLLASFDKNGIPTAALSRPIIITGSQVPMFFQASEGQTLTLNYNTDAFQNFCGALAAAQSGIPEVCVFFADLLFRGNRVLKINASQFRAFSSPNFPALGESGIEFAIDAARVLPPPVSYAVSLDNPQVLQGALAQLNSIAARINQYPVMQFNAFPAWYDLTNTTGLLASLINACVGQGIKGLVLESYGEGNFPSGNPDSPADGATYQALQNANASGVVIVDCTQVIRGIVNDSAYAAGAWLPAVGALNPADMTPMAALAKLMVLLAAAEFNNWSTPDVKTLFQLSLLGEMQSVSRLDSRGNANLLASESLSALDGSASLTNDPASGPVLTDNAGNVLWAALGDPGSVAMPGRLLMQNDGNLVFYDRENCAVWGTSTGVDASAPSMLILSGSTSSADLQLRVLNYLTLNFTATIYEQ